MLANSSFRMRCQNLFDNIWSKTGVTATEYCWMWKCRETGTVTTITNRHNLHRLIMRPRKPGVNWLVKESYYSLPHQPTDDDMFAI